MNKPNPDITGITWGLFSETTHIDFEIEKKARFNRLFLSLQRGIYFIMRGEI